MSRTTYTTTQKTAALVQVERLGGNIPLASLQLGIPERTLYTWRRRYYAENKRQQTPLPPPMDFPDLDDDLQALTYLRRQIMSEVLRLASSFASDSAFTNPQQRVVILTQLVDRLIKLDTHLYTHPQADDDDEIVMEHDVKELPEDEDDDIYGTQEDHERAYQQRIQEENERFAQSREAPRLLDS